MDKRLLLVKFSRFFYKLTFRTGLYRNDLLMKYPSLAGIVEKRFTAPDDHVFILPRDRVIPIDEKLGETEDVVLPSQVIDHFIDKSEYRCIMNFCICRDSNKCKDYPIELGCIFLGNAAKNIHPDIGRSASKEEAKAHARKCSEAGLIHLAGKGKLDEIWLDAHPGDQLFTICNCCPCCCITAGFAYVPENLSRKMTKMPGVQVTITDDCTGCGNCVSSCMYNAVEMGADKAEISPDACKGCGRCVDICPQDAVKLTVTDKGYVQQAIDRLTPIVKIN